MKPHEKPILFIVEPTVLNGTDQFGTSNDLMLISQALRDGYEVYVITPEQLAMQNSTKIETLKLAPIDSTKIDLATGLILHQQAINYCLARPVILPEEYRQQGRIFFEGALPATIDTTTMPIFNRSEPISLDEGFYEILMRMKAAGGYIEPDPELTQKFGDKLAVKAIHYDEKIDDLDLLKKADIQNGQNQISFETGIEDISANKLGSRAISNFYHKLQNNLGQGLIDLLAAEKYDQVINEIYEGKFTSAETKSELIVELQSLYQGAQKCLEHHDKFGQDTILKPASYFGGCGVKRMKGEISVLQIMENFCQIFADIKADCVKRQGENTNLAALPAVIVQKRATEASLGDLRIVIGYGKLQGIFVRVNPKFSQTGAGNISQGGHPESLFKKYSLDKSGVDQMILDMKKSNLDEKSEERKKAAALYGLLEKIDFIKKLEAFKDYPIIGVDALLTQNSNGSYSYGVNEINLTSPAGQTAIMIFEIIYKIDDLAKDILLQAGIIKADDIKTYQILADIFASNNDNDPIIAEARQALGNNQEFQNQVFSIVQNIIYSNCNPMKQSLDGLQSNFEQLKLGKEKPPSKTSPREQTPSKIKSAQEQQIIISS